MSEYENLRTADIVAEALIDWNVNVIFGLPGDGINGFIEALRQRQDKIRFILVRHEESAAFMACAYAKYTEKLGACVATSGPGAIHLLNGLEKDGGKIAIYPDRFDKLITALRTTVDNDRTLDKEAISYNDIFDAFRLAMKFYHFRDSSGN
jgi:basic membrane lipoprotein Med (substrate-binding protein (PBP1-ABC) superfamily)